MTIKLMVIAEDGTPFATVEECRKHELDVYFKSNPRMDVAPADWMLEHWPELKAIVEGKPRSRRPRSDKGTKRVKEVA